jgi:uncharacterized protein DUF3455
MLVDSKPEDAMPTDNFRRRTNGTIDIDAYRQEAIVLRTQTRTRFFQQTAFVARPFIGLAAAVVALGLLQPLMPPAAAEVPDAIVARGEVLVATANAVGAQVYECKSDSAGNLVWQFREPIATLFIAGKTVGRHYAGPNWEMTDGSTVRAKVAGQAPGASAKDIPLLKLEATSWQGTGQLSGVTTIQRLNTRGGRADGKCDSLGSYLSVPYTADYAFYRKGAADARSH